MRVVIGASVITENGVGQCCAAAIHALFPATRPPHPSGASRLEKTGVNFLAARHY
jgi:hypothetical protein